ncbi:MAG: superoxide dismutase [Cetobacterium sp.]|uniref:superoxide dismutase n=1 Tax=Cetobacterium sp. TaxID=2071632 RepID=UPI003F3F444B
MSYPFQLKKLPYEYTDLEPCISKSTLEFHHDKHLKAYTDNFNKAIETVTEVHNCSVEDILKNLTLIPENLRQGVINNGGGVFNHNFYFDGLTKEKNKKIPERLKCLLEENFSSVELFIEQLKKAALTYFGSGWAWLVQDKENGKLKIVTTRNQDTPLGENLNPLLNLDVWEHAYYIDYQNRRADYIEGYMNIIDWDVVDSRLK